MSKKTTVEGCSKKTKKYCSNGTTVEGCSKKNKKILSKKTTVEGCSKKQKNIVQMEQPFKHVGPRDSKWLKIYLKHVPLWKSVMTL